MITGKAYTPDEQPVLVIGLNAEDMALLMTGQVVLLTGQDRGWGTTSVAMMGGKTDLSMTAQLAELGLTKPVT